MKSIHESMRDEKGFTLVELAVVMVIVGLLIGGILKGQEMIANQQVNSTIAQAKSIDAAVSTFRDIYDAMPGDMIDAQNRITGCAGVCVNGDGDNNLEAAPNAAATAEEYNIFRHLAGANLLGGDGVSITAAANFNAGLPLTKITGRRFQPGYFAGGALALNANAANGHYLGIHTADGGANNALTPLEASRIDRKMDDGNPSTGSVFGSVAACVNNNDATIYDEDVGAKNCDVYIRFNS